MLQGGKGSARALNDQRRSRLAGRCRPCRPHPDERIRARSAQDLKRAHPGRPSAGGGTRRDGRCGRSRGAVVLLAQHERGNRRDGMTINLRQMNCPACATARAEHVKPRCSTRRDSRPAFRARQSVRRSDPGPVRSRYDPLPSLPSRRCNHSKAKPINGRKMSLQKIMPALPGAKLWAMIIW
jgi:hypothetical protein